MFKGVNLPEYVTLNGYTVYTILKGRSKVFLCVGRGITLLIDSSVPRLWYRLKGNLHRLGIQKIDFLVLTHAHFDHAGNAARIQKKFNAQIVVHDSEKVFLEHGKNPPIEGTNPFTKTAMNLFGKSILKKLTYEPCQPDLTINKDFSIENHPTIKLIHTPGHTMGSMSISINNEVALVGDTLFGVFSQTVYPPYAENPQQLIPSWKKLLDTGSQWFHPSHGRKIETSLLQMNFNRYYTS